MSRPRTADRRTFVLVHGGGHGGWCWQRLARELREHGHDVWTPTRSLMITRPAATAEALLATTA